MNSMEKEENNFGAFALAAGSSSFPVAGLASPVPSGAGGDAAAAFVPPPASLQRLELLRFACCVDVVLPFLQLALRSLLLKSPSGMIWS